MKSSSRGWELRIVFLVIILVLRLNTATAAQVQEIFSGLEVLDDTPLAPDPSQPEYNSDFLPPLPNNTSLGHSNSSQFGGGSFFSGLQQGTQIPGMMCPLIDGRPRLDLMRAALNLQTQLGMLKRCSNEGAGEGFSKIAENMVASGSRITDIFKNYGEVGVDPKQTEVLQKDLETLVGGLDQLSQALSANNLFNKECGGFNQSRSNLLASMTDLVQTVAPFVISIASLNPAWSEAIPYIIGLKGVSGVLRTLYTFHKQDSVDMDNPAARQAVMSAICEYYRLWSKSKSYLRLKNKKPTQVPVPESLGKTQTLRAYQMQVGKSLDQRYLKLAQAHSDQIQILDNLNKKIQTQQATLRAMKRQVELNPDVTEICTMGTSLAKGAKVSGRLTAGILQTQSELLAVQKNPTEIQLNLRSSESRLRDLLVKNTAPNMCEINARNYLETLNNMTDQAQSAVVYLRQSLRNWANQDANLKNLLQLSRFVHMEEVGDQLIEQAAIGSGHLDNAEIYSALRESKAGLFSGRSGSTEVLFETEGPALAWLNWSETKMRYHENDFSKAMSDLKLALYFESNEARPRLHTMLPRKILEMQGKKSKPTQFTFEFFPEGSDTHQRMCSRLVNIWMNWEAMTTHLSTQYYFCSVIDEMMIGDESSFQKGTRRKCGVFIPLKEVKGENLLTRMTNLLYGRYQKDVKFLSEAIENLQCVP